MEIIITGILAFAATNIDDLFLLTLFFGNKNYKSSQIIIGQLLGIGTLITLSYAGSILGNFVQPAYIGLLGFFPIYLGIKNLIVMYRDKNSADEEIVLKNKNLSLAVLLVTIANGGDNIGIYVPLFVTLTTSGKITMVLIFLLMTLLWCALAKYLARHPYFERILQKYGDLAMQPILILLGLYILYESGTFNLLLSFI